MIYAIAILESPIPTTEPLSVSGKAIKYIQVGQLIVAIVRDLDVEKLRSYGEEILIQAVLAHDRLICQLFTERALLPLRFGTVFKSQLVLEEYLRSQQQELLAKLQKLKGYSEYLLTLTLLTPEPKPELTQILKGKDYLLAKRTHYLLEQTRRSQQQKECQNLTSLFPSQFQVVPPQAEEFLRAYLLADSSEISDFEHIISKWQFEHSHWQLELSHPLPPYHFCD